ncbi:MAG TPA: hypothetical protein VGM56_16855 [Byssovorax sp.]|jgi:hypothetical protein
MDPQALLYALNEMKFQLNHINDRLTFIQTNWVNPPEPDKLALQAAVKDDGTLTASITVSLTAIAAKLST